MKRSALYAVATSSFLGLMGVAVLRWRDAAPTAPVRAVVIPPIARAVVDTADETLAIAEESIVSDDPFRLANAPASVRYDPRTESAVASAGAPATAAPRPMITLKAIVGGPPWQAVVDGLPGQPANTIVRAGATYEKLVARSVTRDSVVIQGPDTTWVLSFRRPE